MYEHLIFFDDECPFCRAQIKKIIKIDGEKNFRFAPLRGETAKDVLSGPQEKLKKSNSLVLAEDYQSTARRFCIRAKAVFRIFWILGGQWKLIGGLSFLPAWLIDPFYRLFAEHRHKYKLKIEESLEPEERFFP